MSTIRRQITIEASPRAVWQALTTPNGLATWLVDEARVDARQGGRIVLKMDDLEETGMLLTFRPISKFEITWDKVSPGPWKGTVTEFTLTRDGKEALLNLHHSGPAFDDEAVQKEADTFWRRAFTALRDGLEG